MEAQRIVFERSRVTAATVAKLALAIGMSNAGRFHGAEPGTLTIEDVRFERLTETSRRHTLYRVRTFVTGTSGGLRCSFEQLKLGERVSPDAANQQG